jgi:hypothetical protein
VARRRLWGSCRPGDHSGAQEVVADRSNGPPSAVSSALAGGLDGFLSSSSPRTIELSRVERLLAALPSRNDCAIYEQQLQSIINNDERIKTVLLEIAKIDGIIDTPTIDRAITRDGQTFREITHQIIDGILQMSPSPFELRGRILDNIRFTFTDRNLKRYIRMRFAA